MKIFEKPDGRREECASLANIGYHMFEVNLEGEVYTYAIPGIEDGCKAERVGRYHSDLAREYINNKGLDGYWQGYRHPK